MNTYHTHRYTFKKELYPLLKLAIPLAMTGVMQSSTFFFETIFLAHIDQYTLAAGALVSWLFGTLAAILFGTLSSINVLVAHKHGANDQEGISLVIRDGLFLALLLTIPSILLFWNMSPIFLLFKQQPSVILLAESYLRALAWGLLPNYLIIAFLEFIIGLGHARIVMFFSVLEVSMNIFFSYILIFGKFGLPVLGIAGAGWGMTISYWITAVALVAYVLTDIHYKKYFLHFFKKRKPSYLWELIKVGVPMGAMYCIEVGFFLALTLIMGSISSQLLAANQIALQYMGALMSVIFSIAQAITVRMGHLIGAKKMQAAKYASYTGIFISGISMVFVGVCYLSFPTLLISVDLDVNDLKNINIVREVKLLLMISAIFQIFEAMRISLFGALRALKDTHFTLLISIISFWFIALPLGYLLAAYFQFGGAGLWWGMVMGALFSVILLYFRFKTKMQYYMVHQLM